MEKSTKLIIAAVGLGGLGYFLYKRGLFSKTTTTEVAKDVKKVDDVDIGKKTAVELTKDCVVKTYNCVTTRYETIQIPIDDEKCGTPMRFGGYQPDIPPCAEPMLDNRFGKNIIDARLNEYLYA